jgi:Ca2+/H+ antiporter, TMEM165/GDT1 family
LTFDGGSWWSYLLVFAAAATPVLEVLVVIPAALLAGMPVVPTVLIAFAGNLSTVLVVIFGADRLRTWWRRRRPARAEQPGRRAEQARRIARRWGVPGLSVIAPISTGTHIAAVVALAIGAERGRVLRWMTAGLAAWAIAAAAATMLGLEALA